MRTTTERTDRLATLHRVRHELARPLTAIRACAELLDDGLCGPLSADQSTQVRRIVRCSGSLTREIDRLHACLAMQLHQPEPELLVQSLNPLCDEAARAARERHGPAAPAVRVPVGPRALAAVDARILAGVLEELLDNAVLHGGGSPVELLVSVERDGCRITITDEGPGLMGEDPERLLEAFSRGAGAASVGKGMGIGLTLAGAWTRAMGGRMTVADGVAGGCVAALAFPRAHAGPPAERETA